MISAFLCYVSCVETPIPSETHFPTQKSMQEVLMRRFLHDICQIPNTEEKFYLSNDTHFFEWLENSPSGEYKNNSFGLTVFCREGIITTLIVTNQALRGTFHYLWAPPSVEVLKIEFCAQKYKLQPRQFPPKAQAISFHYNAIRGSIDLTALPPLLETFGASNNLISGEICLTKLPPRLRSLNLRDNKITQHMLYVANIPHLCACIRLDGNQIDYIAPVDEGENVDWEIFYTDAQIDE